MAINMTLLQNNTGFFDLAQFAAQSTNYLFFDVIVVLLFLIMLVAIYRIEGDMLGSLMVAGWFGGILGIFLAIMGLAHLRLAIGLIVLSAAGYLFSHTRKS